MKVSKISSLKRYKFTVLAPIYYIWHSRSKINEFDEFFRRKVNQEKLYNQLHFLQDWFRCYVDWDSLIHSFIHLKHKLINDWSIMSIQTGSMGWSFHCCIKHVWYMSHFLIPRSENRTHTIWWWWRVQYLRINVSILGTNYWLYEV